MSRKMITKNAYFKRFEKRKAYRKEAKKRPEGSPAEKDVLDTVMKWKQKRRPPSDAKEVAMTVRNLTILSWIGARASIDAV